MRRKNAVSVAFVTPWVTEDWFQEEVAQHFPDVRVVGKWTSMKELLDRRRCAPDFLVLGGAVDYELVAVVASRRSATCRVLVMREQSEREARRLLAAGIAGCYVRRPGDFAGSVRWAGEELRRHLRMGNAGVGARRTIQSRRAVPPIDRLSPAEFEVFAGLRHASVLKNATDDLGYSHGTIRNRASAVLRTLGLSNWREARELARRLGVDRERATSPVTDQVVRAQWAFLSQCSAAHVAVRLMKDVLRTAGVSLTDYPGVLREVQFAEGGLNWPAYRRRMRLEVEWADRLDLGEPTGDDPRETLSRLRRHDESRRHGTKYRRHGSKYRRLTTFLLNGHRKRKVRISTLDRVVLGGLPPSAWRHPEWWTGGSAGHSQARAWFAAGMRVVTADLKSGLVEFAPRQARLREPEDSSTIASRHRRPPGRTRRAAALWTPFRASATKPRTWRPARPGRSRR